jgi:hypothetical protein
MQVVILGREAGVPLELAGVPPESLVPAALQGTASVDDFMARLPEFDAEFAMRAEAAAAKVRRLQQVAVTDTPAGECMAACVCPAGRQQHAVLSRV